MAKHNDAITPSADLAPPADAIAMLKADHCRVLNLFRQYDATEAQDMQRRIAEHVFTELELHAQLEETVFYPAFAVQVYEEGERLVGEAFRAHQLCQDLIAEMRYSADNKEFESRFRELRHCVEQHIAEEEREMFPQAQTLLIAELEEMRDEMQERKQEIFSHNETLSYQPIG